MAHQAFGAAKKILEQIGGLLDAQTDLIAGKGDKRPVTGFQQGAGLCKRIHTRWAAGGGREQCADRPSA